MSNFDHDEILIKYDKLIKQAGVLDAAQVGGTAVALTGAAKTAPKLISMLLGRVGTGAAVGATGGPIGAVIGILGGLWMAYDLYKAFANTNDTIEDLLDKAEALLSGVPAKETKVKEAIDRWVATLQSYKEVFAGGEEITTDPLIQFNDTAKRYKALTTLAPYLKTMKAEWEQAKSRVSGFGSWFSMPGVDKIQFDDTLTKTLAAVEQNLLTATEKLKASGPAALAEIQKKTGINALAVIDEILGLHVKLEGVYGPGKIEYNEQEKRIFSFVSDIKAGKYEDLAALEQYYPQLSSFKNMLQEAFNAASKMKKTQQTKLLSKRAMKTPGGTFTMKGLTGPQDQQEQGAPHQRPARDPVVESIQSSLNTLNAKYQLGFADLAIDGRYGPHTRDALLATMARANVTQMSGITTEQIKDIQTMRANQAGLNGIARDLAATVQAQPNATK